MMLVSLQQASDHLRRDTGDDDADLTLKIKAASLAVINYLGKDRAAEVIIFDSAGDVIVDSSGDPVGVPEAIQAAVMLLIGDLYADRDGRDFIEGGSDDRLSKIILPRTVHFLLDPYRQPRMG